MVSSATLSIEASFKHVKGVSMETIAVPHEITVKVIFCKLRTEALRM